MSAKVDLAFNTRTRRMHSDMRRRARDFRLLTGGRWISLPQALPFELQQLRDWLCDQALPNSGFAAFRCEYCRVIITLEDVQLDHALPVSRGGLWGFANLVIACRRCNQTKGELSLPEYSALLLSLDELPMFTRTYVLKCLRMIGLGARLQRNTAESAAADEGS